MKKLLLLSFVSFLFVGCSTEQAPNQSETFNGESIFVEFMPCEAGPDYSVENMQEMISEWRSLLTTDALKGCLLYTSDAADD